jgi:Cu+-exporting ATPase
MTNTTAAKDPVCGMDVETATAAGRTELQGQTYYFCSSNCQEQFDLNPDQFLGKASQVQRDEDATDGD